MIRRERRIGWLALAAIAVCPGMSALAQGTLERITERGEFRIGYRTDARPLSYEEDGRPAGYSVDICRRIAAAVRDHLGMPDMEVTYVPVTLANRFDKVVNGDIDIECGSTTVTLGRMEQVDFTLMTFVTGGSLLSLGDKGPKTLEDLAGKRVAVITGTTTDDALRAALSEDLIDARVVGVDSSSEAMSQLLNGRVDAFASDQIVLLGDALNVMDRQNNVRFTFGYELFSYEPYALVVRRDDAAFRLVANRAIAQLFRSGQFAVLYQNWIGSNGIEPPPLLLAMYQVNALRE